MAKSKKATRSKRKKGMSITAWGLLLVIAIATALVLARYAVEPDGAEEPVAALQTITGSVQVEVLNACAVPGLAAKATAFLREAGADVVSTDNAPLENQTSIIDRSGDLESAKEIAIALGLPVERVRSQIDPSRYVNVSVVIGRDYKSLTPFKQQ